MLRINASVSAAAKAYYASGLTREGYYLNENSQEIVGSWHGKGAERLHLSGHVTRDAYFALCDNQHPQTGEQLTPRMKDQRRVGFDVTFSAPKSLALLYHLHGDTRILDVFRQAVDDTMHDIEAEMKTRVRVDGADTDRHTGNMVWADFVHFTARPVDGVPDPDLHAHCYAFNLTYDPTEQRWKAGQFGDIKRDATYFEAVFHSRLSQGITQLGYTIERHNKWWDIAGIDRQTIEKFSRRRAVIQEKAAEYGITTPQGERTLTTKIREAKTKGDMEGLRQNWRGRLSAHEYTTLQALGKAAGVHNTKRQQTVTAAQAIAHAKLACFEHESVVAEKKLLEATLRYGYGDVTPEDIKAEAAQQVHNIVWSHVDGQNMVTTREILAEESALLTFARDGRGAELPFLMTGSVPTNLPAWLSQDQRQAILHVLHSWDRVTLVRGGAGTGKTTMMQAAVLAIQQSGKQVFTFAPTVGATEELQHSGFTDAKTIAHLLQNEVLQQRLKGSVIWIDEAGQVGMSDMSKVCAIAKRVGARVILQGDTKQHVSVARGDALRLLEKYAGVPVAQLTEIRRQSGAYKEAIEALQRGDVALGYAKLDALGWVHEIPGEARYDAIAKDYVTYTQQHREKTALIIAPTHVEGEAVTARIREALKKQGRLLHEEQTFFTLRNLHFSMAEKVDAAQYVQGMTIQFQQHAAGIKAGERFRVVRSERGNVWVEGADHRQRLLDLQLAERFQVYAATTLKLSPGDLVQIAGAGQSVEGKRLQNKACYTVTGFDKHGNIVLNNGWTVHKDYAHLAYGYYSTSHSAQGKTVHRVIVANGEKTFGATSREQFYVSGSRGKESMAVYTDNAARLQERIRHSSHRGTATELVEGLMSAAGKPSTAEERHRQYQIYRKQHQAVEQQPGHEQHAWQERNRYGRGMER